MKDHIITIDGGTTNTRCIVFDSAMHKKSEAKREAGARDTFISGESFLKTAVKECLEEAIKKAGITFDEVKCIVGSGMITSEAGLTTVPWIPAPASVKDLHDHMVTVSLPDVCPVPVSFIPGIKNREGIFTADDIGEMDIMRGEETECAALIAHFGTGKKMLFVLPGSHNKFIPVDEEGRILGCITSISGELLSCITKDTLLAKSVEGSFVKPENYDRDMVQKGFQAAMRQGLGKACFNGRLLMLFADSTPGMIANYILGAAMAGDIMALKNSERFSFAADTRVIVAGKEPLSSAMIDCLMADGTFTDIECFEQKGGPGLSAEGAFITAGF